MSELEEEMGQTGIPCDDEAKIEIIANILKHLSAEELLEARLLSRDINEIICLHHTLLWTKSRLLIDTQPGKESASNLEKMWAEIRLSDLITRYNCPNFHINQVNLLSSGALQFFESSVRYQIKHLKLTECKVTSEALLHILSCASTNLEHLEIVGWANFISKSKDKDMFRSIRRGPYLHFLSTIVLQSELDEDDHQHQRPGSCISLSLKYLECIFKGANNLERITFTGWRSETCQNFLYTLMSMSPEFTYNLKCLEISCVIEKGLPARKQYYFLKYFKDIHTPSLQKLTIRFNGKSDGVRGLTKELVEDLTYSLATFLDHSNTNLEVLELINCPVANAVFGPRPSSVAAFHRINTRGIFVAEVNGVPKDVSRKKVRRRRKSSRDRKTKERVGMPKSKPVVEATQPQESPLLQRVNLYPSVCLLVTFAIVLHFGLLLIFDKYPSYVRNNAEVFIHVAIVLWITKGQEIMELWSTGHLIHNFGTEKKPKKVTFELLE